MQTLKRVTTNHFLNVCFMKLASDNKTIICKAPYIRKKFCSEAHKIHCNTHIFKIFIISLNLHIKTKC